MRSLLLFAVFGSTAWIMARTVRNRASRSPAMKLRMLIGGCLSLALGVFIALWLPARVPDTPGSPAALVAIVVLWVLGGGLVYVGVVTLLAAMFARPRTDDATNRPSR